MKYSQFNSKVGNALIISRPTITTCPTSCYFAGNGCYAERSEKRFPNSRKFIENNIELSEEEILTLLKDVVKLKLPIRINANGDLGLNDKVDIKYINTWKKALSKSKYKPTIWLYTHFYSRHISSLSYYGVNVYASIHNKDDYKKAKRAGFKLYAYVSTDRQKKGGSYEYPKYVETILGRTLVCPENRLGRDRVTCAGTSTSTACNFCVHGRGNICFLSH